MMNVSIQISHHRQAKVLFWSLATLRFILCIALLAVVDRIFNPGTPLFLLAIAGGAGIYLSSLLAFSNLRGSTIALTLLGFYLIFRGTVHLCSIFMSETSSAALLPELILMHAHTILIVLILASLLTWLYWKTHHMVTFEALTMLLISLTFLADHRNYNFAQAPRIVSEFAWHLGLNHLYTFVFLGTIFSIIVLVYISLSQLPGIPKPARSWNREPQLLSRPMFFRSLLVFILYALLILTIARLVYIYHEGEVNSLGSHGVSFMESGDESLGKSPLGFHSALGSNNQPAALVRLETDYPENPHSPMLYLREGVLSKFNGNEIVSAGKEFNTDVPLNSPEEYLERDQDHSLLNRTPVVQSIYTLANHSTAFAIDYPILMERVKNPAPERFRSAYSAHSLAPAYSTEELTIFSAGSESWGQEKREHYLETHTDERYTQLAREITFGLYSDYDKAQAIADYLSSNSIYTLSPNHDVPDDGDPVASYLFGDMRGYCVHFAHATTYMLRAIGIPARISTGYLTDMSQARDGHILLRMSDRHAWAEAYFDSQGWVVFDTQPETVESHADSDVDMSLLEELMGLVGPESQFLDETLLEGEPDPVKTESYLSYLPTQEFFIYLLLFFLVFLVLIKLYLRSAWRLSSSSGQKLERAYLGLASTLVDLGIQRKLGETRNEFARRIKGELDVRIFDTVRALNLHRYSNSSVSNEDTTRALESDFATVRALPKWLRLRALVNPSSAFRFILNGRW